ncbi:MAG: hypothetical protein ACXITV_08165 [Luteibaculaceae bacterium]
MKKVIKFLKGSALLYLLGLFLFTGCSKKSDDSESYFKNNEEKQIMNLTFYLSMLDENNHLVLDNGKEIGIVATFFAEPINGNFTKAIVCENSNAISFAKCAKDWMDNNPGRCLKIWESNGTYYADDDC